MKLNSVVDQALEAFTQGNAVILFEGNVDDHVLGSDPAVPPMLLHHALAHAFGRRGYHVGRLGLSRLASLRSPTSTAPGKWPFADISCSSFNETLQHAAAVLRKQDAKAILLIDPLEVHAPDGEAAQRSPEQSQSTEILREMFLDDSIRQSANAVIGICRTARPHASLTALACVITALLPGFEERKAYLELLLRGTNGKRAHKLEPGLTAEQLARQTGGLRLTQLRRMLAAQTVIRRSAIRPFKNQVLSDTLSDLVEIVDPDHDVELVGLDNIKDVLGLIADQVRQGSSSVPKAIILAGPPGNGKSHTYQWFVRRVDLPGLIVRDIFNRWVGSSEANLSRLIEQIKAQAPCVVLIEEIDLFGIGSRKENAQSDGGTTGRISARFLEWLGSESLRGQTIVVATTNRPDRLDAALRDRFALVIPYLHPSPESLPALCQSLATRMRRQFAPDIPWDTFSSLPHLSMPTVRALAEIVAQTAMRTDAQSKDRAALTAEHLMAAARDWRPTYDPLEHEFLALKAIELTSFKSLLPWMSLQGRRPGAHLPPYLQQYISPDGDVDAHKLAERIRALEKQLTGTPGC